MDEDRKHRRNSDPHTSHDAAGESEAKRRDRMRVWAAYRAAKRPLATFQLEEIMGGAMDGKWRKRRSDLSNDGWLVDTGMRLRCPDTGKEQIVWAMSDRPIPEPPPKPQMDLGL